MPALVHEQIINLQALAQFLEFSPQSVAIFDTNMRYIAVSNQWYTDYNLIGKDILGKSHYDIFPEITQEWKDIHQQCLAGAVMSRDADPFVRADGTTDYVKWTLRPWHEADGVTIGGIMMYTEIITQQMEANNINRKILARYEALTEHNPEFVAFLNKDGIIEEMNHLPIAVREQVIGIPYALALQTDPMNTNPYEPVELFKHTVATGEVSHYYARASSQKTLGVVADYDSYIIPLYEDGEIAGAVIIATDISEARLAQRKLEETIRELNQSLLFKDQFLATMSHELRTPMNAIMGYSSLGIKMPHLDDKTKNMMERILINSRRLLNLINDILDISRINAGRVQLVQDPFDLHHLADGWKSDYEQLAVKKGLTFEYHLDPTLPKQIIGDSERLTQIVVNLINNAIKFTDTGSITLSVRQHADDPNKMDILVTDTGIGISNTWHHLIFEEFRQVEMGSERNYGGAGLGLSIVQKLCILMGGTVSVASKVGEGSTFTVTLPIAHIIE